MKSTLNLYLTIAKLPQTKIFKIMLQSLATLQNFSNQLQFRFLKLTRYEETNQILCVLVQVISTLLRQRRNYIISLKEVIVVYQF